MGGCCTCTRHKLKPCLLLSNHCHVEYFNLTSTRWTPGEINRKCCLSSYAWDWLQLAKSILSAESARSLGQVTATVARLSSVLTLSELQHKWTSILYYLWLQPDCLCRATLIQFCKTRGAGISYSLSINAVIIVAICGCATRRKLWSTNTLLFLGRLHQETCPCLRTSSCQRLCTRSCPSDSVATATQKMNTNKYKEQLNNLKK